MKKDSNNPKQQQKQKHLTSSPRSRSRNNNNKKRMSHNSIYEPNNRKGWSRMAVYWLIGCFVGYWKGYFSSIFHRQTTTPQSSFVEGITITKWHVAALVVTCETHRVFQARQSNYGRKRSWLGTTVFSIMNGTLETFLFLATFDVGYDSVLFFVMSSPVTTKDVTVAPSWTTNMIAKLVGFTTFSIYSAWIHDKFWLPLVFPPHIKPNASPFTKSALPALVVMSIFWMVILYDSTSRENMVVICILHTIFNFLGMADICLPSPFEK